MGGSYQYDAENRLTEAWSGIRLVSDAYTAQGTLIADHAKRNAKYYYYLHGPLARTELGDERRLVQGLDYAYTLQGWLKGVNGQNPNGDMFGDGTDTTVAKDAFAYSLGYYNGDYTPITNSATALNNNFSYLIGTTGKNLFNGNISSSTMSIPQLSNTVNGFTYSYDQLNRIKQVNRHEGIQNGWTNPITKYHEEFNYDANGNILSAIRNDGNGAMDNLAYQYNKVNGQMVNNKLNFVTNGTSTANSFASQSTGNYDYDAIGNLIKDNTAGINNIDWTVYGKIKTISKAGGNLDYSYNSAGQRVSKTTNGLTTWYVRDAQGNTMAVYDNAAGRKTWKEQHLYGSSRLGTWNPNVAAIDNNSTTTGKDVWQTVGTTQYELSNHLGNVMATITDKRLQVDNGSGAIASYTPDVSSAQEYYAFGSLMPGRAANATGYRYGFNGKENDNDAGKGTGNQQDYGMRIYDPQIGKFLSVDPLSPQYPELTPYQFASNSPIANVDLDGEEAKYYTLEQDAKTGKASLKLVKQVDTFKDIGGKTVQYPLQYYVSFKGESYSFFNGGGRYGVVPENSIENFNAWTGSTIPFNDIFYSDNEAWGRVLDDIGNEWAEGLAMAYSGRGTGGSIYEVPGEYTDSGKPYVGRNNTTDPATNRRSNDGRDRTKAKIIGIYDANNVEEGQYQEQKAMDQRGTPRKTLDNKRREVNRQRMKTLEAKYGDGKKVGPVLIPQRSNHTLPKSKSQQKKEADKKREASDLLINHG